MDSSNEPTSPCPVPMRVDAPPRSGHRWILWVSSIWAARVAFALLSMALPLLFEAYYELSVRLENPPGAQVQILPWDSTLAPLFHAEDEDLVKVFSSHYFTCYGVYIYF